MRTAVVALVTLLIGFALGWALKPTPSPVAAASTEAIARTETRVVTKTVEVPAAKRERATPSLEHQVQQLTVDKAAAEARVAELEAQLDNQRAVTKQLEGRAIAWPDSVDPRFTEPRFLAALNDAMTKEKLPGEVRGLDCTEFPCIAHGQLELDNPRDREKLERLFASMKSRYPGADFYISQTVHTDDPNGSDPAQQRFSMSFYPPERDDEARRAMNVRLRSRKNAYVDAE